MTYLCLINYKHDDQHQEFIIIHTSIQLKVGFYQTIIFDKFFEYLDQSTLFTIQFIQSTYIFDNTYFYLFHYIFYLLNLLNQPNFVSIQPTKMSQNVKFKVKQFEWFEMQTKVRQIIQQVLAPLTKRILQNSNIINRVKFNQGEDQKKIQQITLMIQNDPKVFQTGIFASVDKKFQKQQKMIEQLSRQIQQQNKYVERKFEILDIRMQESSEVLQNVALLRQRVSKQIQLQREKINTVREHMQQIIDQLNSDIRRNREQQQKNLQACEKTDYKLEESINKNNEKIKQMEQVLQNHKELHRQQALKLQHHSETIKTHSQEIQILQQSKIMTKKLSDYVKDLQNQLRMVEFKLQAVSPLITEAQISQCLYSVLPQKMRKRIAIHEHKKYSKLNREVLEKPYKQVQQKFKGLKLLEEMQKKNTKQIVQLKRQKLISQGIDIDHLTYEQRQRYYNEMVLEDNTGDDDQQVKVSAKVDEKQVITIMDKHFNTFVNNIKDKVAKQLQDSKKYVYGIQDQIRHQISKFQNRISNVKNQLQIYQADQLLQNKAFNIQFKQIKQILQDNIVQHQKIYETMKSYYNFCSLLNHLSIQDEIDKQNISLMGVSENNSEDAGSYTRNKNSIVELDKKCFSCCGFPASTLSAFKMACLAYNPSSITIDTKQYKRQELLGITTSLLQKIKKNFISNERSNISQAMSDSHIVLANSPENEQSEDKLFLNQEIKERFNETEPQNINKKHSSGVKFRKTRKMMGNSSSKYYSNTRSTAKNSNRDETLLSTSIFNDIKRRNINFLN